MFAQRLFENSTHLPNTKMKTFFSSVKKSKTAFVKPSVFAETVPEINFPA